MLLNKQKKAIISPSLQKIYSNFWMLTLLFHFSPALYHLKKNYSKHRYIIETHMYLLQKEWTIGPRERPGSYPLHILGGSPLQLLHIIFNGKKMFNSILLKVIFLDNMAVEWNLLEKRTSSDYQFSIYSQIL